MLDEEEAQHDLAPGGPCPFLGREAWVSAEGRFDPCCAPDAQRRTLGEFGNLHERGLMDIWRGDAYRALVATYRTRAPVPRMQHAQARGGSGTWRDAGGRGGEPVAVKDA